MTDQAHGQCARPDLDESDILPCPFCGKAPFVEPTGFHLGGRTIRCETEDCMGPHTTAACVSDAVAQWNTRPSLPAPGREEMIALADRIEATSVVSVMEQPKKPGPIWAMPLSEENQAAIVSALRFAALSRPPENVDHRATEPASSNPDTRGCQNHDAEDGYPCTKCGRWEDQSSPRAGEAVAPLSDKAIGEGSAALSPSSTAGDSDSARLRSAGQSDKWQCMARRNATPDPVDCNWPDCGCDPHATKVIESLIEQGWSDGRTTGGLWAQMDAQSVADTRNIIADEYEDGLRKMEAAGYEEFAGPIMRHKVVIEALRFAARHSPVECVKSISEDSLMKALLAANVAVRPLIVTVWKDSIDIDQPSYAAIRLSEEILKRVTMRSPAGSAT